jgi:hypothetical protein
VISGARLVVPFPPVVGAIRQGGLASRRIVPMPSPLLVSVTFGGFVLACGAAPPAPSTSPAPATAESHAAPGPGEWATWSVVRKKQYMESVVIADAKKMFAHFDPVRYREVTCKTCHGPGAEDGTYKMPNPALPKVRPEKVIELAKTKPELFIFMDGAVVPHVAKLLGQPTFDHVTMSGFGCFKCHTPER